MFATTPLSSLVCTFGLCALLFGVIGALGHQNIEFQKERLALQRELTATKREFASTSTALLGNINALEQLLATNEDARANLEKNLEEEQALIDAMREQVAGVAGVVDTLQKLSGIDRELLKKYSRVYFLNEHYEPKHIVAIPEQYVYDPLKEKFILSDVWPFLHEMLDDAAMAGVDLRVISAFRSYGTQSLLKSAYKVTYGAGTANKFSADQGYSEHQLGTTVDFTTFLLGTQFTSFEKTITYQWLTQNAYKYGFVLSYPKNNTYYVFEPWHWRFVGKNLARTLHDTQKYFYDLSQREIDLYLVSLFDTTVATTTEKVGF